MEYPPNKASELRLSRWLFKAVIFAFLLHIPEAFSADQTGKRPPALIDPARVLELQKDNSTSLRVLRVSGRAQLKQDGWLIDYDGLPGMLSPPGVLSQAAGKSGLSPRDVIVIVPADKDIWGYAAATRLFWTLRMMGHEKLFLLEGAVPEGFENKTSTRSHYPLEKVSERWITDMGGVYAGDDYQTPPLDIRDVERSEGYTTHPLVHDPGTIYGALNIPPVALFNNGKFKSKAELEHLMSDVIGQPPGPVVVFSDTGLRAAIAWFAIHEILGLQDVRIYDGGYIDWDSQDGETYDERNDMGDALG